MARRKEPPKRDLFDLDEWYRDLDKVFRAEIVLFAKDGNEFKLLMMQRDQAPDFGHLALPGSYLRPDVDLEMTIRLVVKRLGVEMAEPMLFHVASHPDRDRRHRAISVVYLASASLANLLDLTHRDPRFRIVTAHADHSPILLKDRGLDVIDVASDHRTLIYYAFLYLQRFLDSSTIAFGFLPSQFTLTELQQIHELILGQKLETGRFRKRVLGRIYPGERRLRPAEGRKRTAGRPARLYELRKIEQDEDETSG